MENQVGWAPGYKQLDDASKNGMVGNVPDHVLRGGTSIGLGKKQAVFWWDVFLLHTKFPIKSRL